jgi:chemotaxis protein MotB
LRAISAVLRVDNHQVQIEGHTDNLPIHNPAFPSNWELSAMRASTVARLLTENGVDERRITAIGQGAKMPVGDNATPDGRAKNRRVTVNVLATLAPPPPDITGGSH